MNFSRPDIEYVVGRLSRYTHSPNQDYWDVLVRLMRYLRSTMDYGIEYNVFPAILKGYSNSKWIFDQMRQNLLVVMCLLLVVVW